MTVVELLPPDDATEGIVVVGIETGAGAGDAAGDTDGVPERRCDEPTGDVLASGSPVAARVTGLWVEGCDVEGEAGTIVATGVVVEGAPIRGDSMITDGPELWIVSASRGAAIAMNNVATNAPTRRRTRFVLAPCIKAPPLGAPRGRAPSSSMLKRIHLEVHGTCV
jgi:hypothetical protein